MGSREAPGDLQAERLPRVDCLACLMRVLPPSSHSKLCLWALLSARQPSEGMCQQTEAPWAVSATWKADRAEQSHTGHADDLLLPYPTGQAL